MRGKDRKNRTPQGVKRKTGRAGQSFRKGSMDNPQVREAMLETVENQLRLGDPPETRQTFERLLAAGHSQQQAMELIGAALLEEISTVLLEDKPFDRARFAALLAKLS